MQWDESGKNGSIALTGYDEGLSTEAPIENGRKYNPDVINFFTYCCLLYMCLWATPFKWNMFT